MDDANRPNSPGGRPPATNVQRLQRRLYVAAKQNPERCFHALYDRIYRIDVLWEAWRQVKANKGAAGVDAMTIAAVVEYGEERFLSEIRDVLREGEYRPAPVLRRYIPKADGRKRPLGIPTVRDRVVQAATKIVLEPIFEAGFRECSYGFRPKRSATGALEQLRKLALNHVLDADIRDYFGSIDHELLMKRAGRRISDRRVLKLLRQWLTAGVLEGGRETTMTSGTPQGGVISPLLSNIYLSFLDEVWETRCAHVGTLVRYADDFVVMCRTKKQVEEAARRIAMILARLKLELHPEKTRTVDLSLGNESFDFLGCTLRKRMSGRIWEKERKRVYFLQREPSPRSMNRIREKVRARTGSDRNRVKDVRVLIEEINPVLRGWGNYFRTGNAGDRFNQVDRFVTDRLRRFMIRRRGRNLRAGAVELWDHRFFERHGLHRLSGTVRYPGTA
jgi:group II intron reverse transcriptase/maturase